MDVWIDKCTGGWMNVRVDGWMWGWLVSGLEDGLDCRIEDWIIVVSID